MNKLFKLLLCLPLAANALSLAVEDILRAAIQTGYSEGLVLGPVAEKAKRELRAQGPLTLKVTRQYEFKQEGCARLRLDFNQSQAFPQGSTKVADYAWSSELSICLDGQPPIDQARKT